MGAGALILRVTVQDGVIVPVHLEEGLDKAWQPTVLIHTCSRALRPSFLDLHQGLRVWAVGDRFPRSCPPWARRRGQGLCCL